MTPTSPGNAVAGSSYGSTAKTCFSCNGREYVSTQGPGAVICLDGSSDEYLNAALNHGAMPNLAAIIANGHRLLARAAMPTFTNPNNSSIITGTPPAVHGIGGNFFFDKATQAERMMNSAGDLRVTPITTAAARAGLRVAVVTAKDKLRAILSKDLADSSTSAVPTGCVSVSAEKVASASAHSHGMDASVMLDLAGGEPNIYSAEASLFVLRLGAALAERQLADLMYLSTTDFIQHKHGPEEPEAIDFYGHIDHALGRLLRAGVRFVITADHGMNWKVNTDGSPRAVYLLDVLKEVDPGARVILPITDPYVRHHAAFGSYAGIHVSSPSLLSSVMERVAATPGITEVYEHASAVRLLQLPPDRTADVVVVSGRDVVLGTSAEQHDLQSLDRPLRSHGGRFEEMVPMIVSGPLGPVGQRLTRGDLRNFDAFAMLLDAAGKAGGA